MLIIQARRLLRQAIRTVEEGGTPARVGPSYYGLTTVLEVLPRDANWRGAGARHDAQQDPTNCVTATSACRGQRTPDYFSGRRCSSSQSIICLKPGECSKARAAYPFSRSLFVRMK